MADTGEIPSGKQVALHDLRRHREGICLYLLKGYLESTGIELCSLSREYTPMHVAICVSSRATAKSLRLRSGSTTTLQSFPCSSLSWWISCHVSSTLEFPGWTLTRWRYVSGGS